MKQTITIQGIAGCYHDAAAREYFSKYHPTTDIEILECNTFTQLFERLDSDASLNGIVAIENTIAGPLLQNHELLRKSNLIIAGEHKMRISHVLAALPGQLLSNITEVCSHPMALMQCEQFLRSVLPKAKMTETFDTAGSARDIAEAGSKGQAAICGRYAAELYGLEILAENIETNKRNFTRFLILADKYSADNKKTDKNIDKASIVFTLPHSKGALSKVLTILSFYDINLTKIQSTPIIGREWEYRFYVDLTFDSYARYLQAINAVRPLLTDYKSLGQYKECDNEI